MSGTSAVTAVIYAGTSQSLNGLAGDLLACVTLYQSCHSRSLSSCIVPALVSLHVVAGLQRLIWKIVFVIKSFLPSIFTYA